ncbi:MAG: hypothetical protein Q8N03_06265 [Ignavibacteria bacterium]|nr:hypothetical protein [Ignavibacteria bacterium]
MNNYRCMIIKNSKNLFQCQYCGNVTEVIWVHGHGQCAYCRTNIDECCSGETTSSSNVDNEKETNKEKYE